MDEIEYKIHLFPSVNSESTEFPVSVFNNTFLCEDILNKDNYSFWKSVSKKNLDEEDILELWLDDKEE